MTVPAPLIDQADMAGMGVGDSIFWRGVAQQKPAIRKRVLSELGALLPSFTVRYVGGGVQLTRISE